MDFRFTNFYHNIEMENIILILMYFLLIYTTWRTFCESSKISKLAMCSYKKIIN